jgi:hypothetical protein
MFQLDPAKILTIDPQQESIESRNCSSVVCWQFIEFSGEFLLSTDSCFISNNTGIFFFGNFEDLPNSNVPVFTLNIHQNKALNLPKFICSKRTTLGKAYGTKCGAIGNMLGEQFENLNEEQSENLMGTTWEPQKSKKSNSPHLSQKGKEKKQNKAPGVHAFSPHWLPSICMSPVCFSPFLAYENGINSVTKA